MNNEIYLLYGEYGSGVFIQTIMLALYDNYEEAKKHKLAEQQFHEQRASLPIPTFYIGKQEVLSKFNENKINIDEEK